MHSRYPQIQTANYWKSKTLRALKRNRMSPLIYEVRYYRFLWNGSKTTMFLRAHITGSTSASKDFYLYTKFHPRRWMAFRQNLIFVDQTAQFCNGIADHDTASNQNNIMTWLSCFILPFQYKLYLGQEIQKCNLAQFPSFLDKSSSYTVHIPQTIMTKYSATQNSDPAERCEGRKLTKLQAKAVELRQVLRLSPQQPPPPLKLTRSFSCLKHGNIHLTYITENHSYLNHRHHQMTLQQLHLVLHFPNTYTYCQPK